MPSKKTIALVLILASFLGSLFFTPLRETKAAAITWDIPYIVDNFIIRPLMRKVVNAIENRLLNTVGRIVADTANGGKDPYWITNWRNHILDSNARGVDVFRAVLADTELCPHFGDSLKNIFQADKFEGLIEGSGNLTFAPGTNPFQVSNRCTVDFDVDAFRDDFSQGGWEAWNQLLQPQNNFFGAYFSAISEAEGQLGLESQSSQDQSVAQKGFQGGKLDAFIGGTHASGCVKKGIENRCTFMGKTVTPGTLFDQATEKRLDQKFETIGGSREIEDLILALSDAVVTKISNQLGNLLGLDIAGAPIDNGVFEERSFQQELDAAAGARDSTADAGRQKLVCQQQCQNTLFPECDSLQGDAFVQCNRTATARCILNCP